MFNNNQEKLPSIRQLLNVELLALIEYAHTNSNVHVDYKKLESALTALASAELSDDAQGGNTYVAKGKQRSKEHQAAIDNTKKEKLERINKNLQSKELVDRMNKMCIGAISSGGPALAHLYTMGGSAIKFFDYDKQLKRDTYNELHTTDIPTLPVIYFVPRKIVIDLGRDLIQSAGSFANLMTAVNRETAVLCHYNCEQAADKNGYKYIEGGKAGLEQLVGNNRGTGILYRCGLRNVRPASLIEKPREENGLRYHIALDEKTAELFEKMLKDDSSPLRQNDIQLTTVTKAHEDSTTSQGTSDEESEETNAMEGKLANRGNEAGARENNKTPIENLKDSVRLVLNKVNKYMSLPSDYAPPIKIAPMDTPVNDDDAILKQIEYISKFAVVFGKLFGVAVDLMPCTFGHNVYNIARYTVNQWSSIGKRLANDSKFTGIRMRPKLYELITKLNESLNTLLQNIQDRLSAVFDTIQFNVDESKVMSSTDRDELNQAAKEIDDIQKSTYKIAPDVPPVELGFMFNSIEEVSKHRVDASHISDDHVSDDFASSTLIPKELLDATEELADLTKQISLGTAPSKDQIEQFKRTELPIIVKYGVHHEYAKYVWGLYNQKRIGMIINGKYTESTLQSIVDETSPISYSKSSLVQQLKNVYSCLESYNYDGGQQFNGSDYVKVLTDAADKVLERYPADSSQSVEKTEAPVKHAYSEGDADLLAEKELSKKRQELLDKRRNNSPARPTDAPMSSDKPMSADELKARMMMSGRFAHLRR